MKIPVIGETVELFYNGKYHIDWLTMKRFDRIIDKVHYVDSGVLVWGKTQERFEAVDIWRTRRYSKYELAELYAKIGS